VCRQSPPDGTGLLWAEIEGDVFLSLVEEAELVALLSIDDSKDLGNRFAYVVDLGEFRSSTTSHLLHPQFL